MRIFPPRPESAIAEQLIPFYENRGFIAQIKKNGTCSLAVVDSEGRVEFWTRHWEKHRAWSPTDEITGFFSNFPNSTFVFELLHSKTVDVKNTAYVFDVLRYMGKDLTGVSLEDRLDLFKGITPLSKNIEIAKTYTAGLRSLYKQLDTPEDEGIVLKDPKAPLRPVYRDGLNANWQVKCRRATKNYSF